jgi:hypothetical protein
MAQFYTSFASTSQFLKLPYSAGQQRLLRTVAQCTEVLDGIPLRRDDKRTLRAIDTHACRFRLGERVSDPSGKAFVLLQASLGRARLDDARLSQDASLIMSRAHRAAKAMSALLASADVRSPAAVNSRIVERSLHVRLWSSPAPAKSSAASAAALALSPSFADVLQLSAVHKHITDAMVAAWSISGITSVRHFLETPPAELAARAPRCRQVAEAASAAQRAMRGLRSMRVSAKPAPGDDAVIVTLQPNSDGLGWHCEDPSTDTADDTAPRWNAKALRQYDLFVCRNCPGGLVDVRTIDCSTISSTLHVPLKQAVFPTVLELAHASGAGGVVAEQPGNPSVVFIHLLHKQLVGMDWFAQVDMATGVTRDGPFAQCGIAPAAKPKPTKPAPSGNAANTAPVAAAGLSASEILAAIEADPFSLKAQKPKPRAKRGKPIQPPAPSAAASASSSASSSSSAGVAAASASPPLSLHPSALREFAYRPEGGAARPMSMPLHPTGAAAAESVQEPLALTQPAGADPARFQRGSSVAASVGGRSVTSITATNTTRRALDAFVRHSERFQSGIVPGFSATPALRSMHEQLITRHPHTPGCGPTAGIQTDPKGMASRVIYRRSEAPSAPRVEPAPVRASRQPSLDALMAAASGFDDLAGQFF